MDILIKALQLILSFSILIITHEFGHFITAKLFKTRVDKFYLFFDPWFSLFKFRRGETEYGLGWLPLGGYVKIAGMIDESMDTEHLSKPAEPWEFRAKPAWQRLLIMVAGVVVNFVSAMLIFWMILFTWGKQYVPLSEAHFGLEFSEVMHQIGFEDGDRVLSVDGEMPETCGDLSQSVLLNGNCRVEVERAGVRTTIVVPDTFAQTVLEQEVRGLCALRIPVVVDSVLAGTPAAAAGLMRGDSLMLVDGSDDAYFGSLTRRLAERRDSTVTLVVRRADSSVDTLGVTVDANGRIGFYNCVPTRWIRPSTHQYGFFEACPAGIGMGFDILGSYVRQMKLVFSKEGVKQLGGFGTIGSLFPDTWNWMTFWFNTAFLAIILAFMNILPIPALDGGHVLFLVYEMVSGRKPSDKFLEYAQVVGMVLLFGLMIYANGNDLFKAIFK